MLVGGEIVSAAEEFEVVAGAIAADLVHELDKTQIKNALRGGITDWLAFRAHNGTIVRRKWKSFIAAERNRCFSGRNSGE